MEQLGDLLEPLSDVVSLLSLLDRQSNLFLKCLDLERELRLFFPKLLCRDVFLVVEVNFRRRS